MQLILRVQSPGENRSVAFRAGQVVQIGRTEWANLCLPGDARMADVHCEIQLHENACLLRSLNAEAPTLLNGEPIDEAPLSDGDVISAGTSQFNIEIRGMMQDAESAGRAADEAAGAPSVGPAAAICEKCEFDIADFGLDVSASLKDFVDAALESARYAEATTFLANAMSKPEAVWWASCCVEHAAVEIGQSDQAAITAARDWVADESEENRRKAEAEVGAAESVAAQIAMAVHWSSGSIAPPDAEPVVADDSMTNRLVTAAVLQALFLDESKDPIALLKEFGDIGLAVVAGENRWA